MTIPQIESHQSTGLLTIAGPLTPAENLKLLEYEQHLAKDCHSFVDQGNALAAICDQRLYRATHRTFHAYHREKWHYEKSQVYRLIGAAEVVGHISPIGELPQPMHESQVRPLIGLPAELVIAAWRKAIELAAGNPITARIVRRAAIEIGALEPSPPRFSPRKRLRQIARLVSQANDLAASEETSGVLRSLLAETRDLLIPLVTAQKPAKPSFRSEANLPGHLAD